MGSEELKSSDYVQTNRNLEKLWFPKVQKTLKSKVNSLIEKVKSDGIEAGIQFLSTDLGNERLKTVVENLYTEVGVRHARKTDVQLRQSIRKSWSPEMEEKRAGFAQAWIDFIQAYLKIFLIDKITFRVNDTTRAKLLNVMNEAIEKGWGITETVKHLEELPFTAYQAARIVRTEINRAANVGIQAQGETFEYQLQKSWIAVNDNRTRGRNPEDHADHWGMKNQTVDWDQDFIDPRNNKRLKHPGDPEAGAEETCNCRCNMKTIPKRDAAGNLIPKSGKAFLPALTGKSSLRNESSNLPDVGKLHEMEVMLKLDYSGIIKNQEQVVENLKEQLSEQLGIVNRNLAEQKIKSGRSDENNKALMEQILSMVGQMNEKLDEKHKWRLNVTRDGDKLITGATAEQI